MSVESAAVNAVNGAAVEVLVCKCLLHLLLWGLHRGVSHRIG